MNSETVVGGVGVDLVDTAGRPPAGRRDRADRSRFGRRSSTRLTTWRAGIDQVPDERSHSATGAAITAPAVVVDQAAPLVVLSVAPRGRGRRGAGGASVVASAAATLFFVSGGPVFGLRQDARYTGGMLPIGSFPLMLSANVRVSRTVKRLIPYGSICHPYGIPVRFRVKRTSL